MRTDAAISLSNPAFEMQAEQNYTAHSITIRMDVLSTDFVVNGTFARVSIEMPLASFIAQHEQAKRVLRIAERMNRTVMDDRPIEVIKAHGRSSFMGVCKPNQSASWRANIQINGKRIWRSLPTELDAAKQYNAWVIEHNLNRPLNIIPE